MVSKIRITLVFCMLIIIISVCIVLGVYDETYGEIETVRLNWYEKILSNINAGKVIILAILLALIIAGLIFLIVYAVKAIVVKKYVKLRLKAGANRQQIKLELTKKGLSGEKAERLLR